MKKLLFVVLAASIAAWSQTSTGSIRGTVTDPTSAAVPNAKVIAADADRGVNYTTLTDSAGRYISTLR